MNGILSHHRGRFATALEKGNVLFVWQYSSATFSASPRLGLLYLFAPAFLAAAALAARNDNSAASRWSLVEISL